MNYEQNIKEARTIEAMKNGYMGLAGKFCQIARTIGSPVINQGSLHLDTNYLEDIFQENETENIKTMDENEATYEIGWQFDGLSRGMNISILVFNHKREITVYHEGAIVYKESSGELESYAPNKVWEEWINKIYETTKKIKRRQSFESNKALDEQKEEKKLKILDELRKKWGI